MKTYKSFIVTSLVLLTLIILSGCQHVASEPAQGSFASDRAFLEQHTDVVVLKKGRSAVAVVPAYQGRVMTSTFDRTSGPSFGWINRPVIEKGLLSDAEKLGTLQEHIYVFGGEERFWLGPEGGQFGLFFKPGTKFEFADWTTPPAIDTEPFKLIDRTSDSAKFQYDCELANYSGTTFKMGIERTVRVLDDSDVESLIGGKLAKGIRMVGYETDNRLTNRGSQPWVPESGLPSIWMLGMFNPSPKTTIVIPFKAGSDVDLGPKVNDAYFGKVPPEHLKVEDDVLFFKGDGTRRGKIGISPRRSKGIAGSYDADGQVLTLVTYNVQAAPNGFVNSMWEFQKEPYSGDVINSYNDGSPAPGEPPLGPFYELETSSPAAALNPGQTLQHVQQTLHLQGPQEQLDPIARRMLGVGIETVKRVFQFDTLAVTYSPAQGIGPEKGVMRRDPSDIIKVGNLYYLWYSKGPQAHGYNATIWYATSPDGYLWTEKGEALARGGVGSWDEQSVFTPNILVAEGKYWLFYTAVPKPFTNTGNRVTKSAIGIACSDSPDGPWVKLPSNPVLKTSDDPSAFDSMRVDDACLLVREGKYWLYYKGRQWDNTPGNTKMGVAVAENPGGSYLKHTGNPVIAGGHEVLVWPFEKGVVAMVNIGPKGIRKTLQYAPDGLAFEKWSDLKMVPHAAGAYRPEAFTDSRTGTMPEWGVQIGTRKGYLPFLERFDFNRGSN